MRFTYILEKIKNADFLEEPFPHIELDNLFTPEDFSKIISSKEVTIAPSSNDSNLFNNLFDAGYKIIQFPGCVQDKEKYIKWHETKKLSHQTNTTCEGFGIVLRLAKSECEIIRELTDFLNSEEFKNCISEKFEINLDDCTYDNGIQKYLDGYEISPHPDIQKKALTYMVNINPDANSENENHHTHYLNFNPERMYIREFWNGNKNVDRCWVPWSWCETKKMQVRNNSIVIFSPSVDTMHGVKANYNHLNFQRTQLYGNLWYKNDVSDSYAHWEDLAIVTSPSAAASKNNLSKFLPGLTRRVMRKAMGNTSKV